MGMYKSKFFDGWRVHPLRQPTTIVEILEKNYP